MPYLSGIGSDFEKAIKRGWTSIRSDELDDAVRAVKNYIEQPTPQNIKRVNNQLAAWRQAKPQEYNQRHGTQIYPLLKQELDDHLRRWGIDSRGGETADTTNYYLSRAGEFEERIKRGWTSIRSGELDDAVRAINNYIKKPSAENIRQVNNLLAAWRRDRGQEFSRRGHPIENQLRAELHQHLNFWGVHGGVALAVAPPAAVHVNALEWVRAKTHQLKALAQRPCSDASQYQDWIAAGHQDEVLNLRQQWLDSNHPPGLSMPTKPTGSRWDSNHYKLVYYDVMGEAMGHGRMGRGAGWCATFAMAAAYVLTLGRLQGPRVEIVTHQAHTYVLVNRRGDYGANFSIPDDWRQENGVIIVDVWLGALCNEIIYQGTAAYPQPQLLTPISVVSERPAT